MKFDEFMTTATVPDKQETQPAKKAVNFNEFMGSQTVEPRPVLKKKEDSRYSNLPGPYRSFVSSLNNFAAGAARIPGFLGAAAINQGEQALYGAIPPNAVEHITGWRLGAKPPEWMADNPVARYFDDASKAWSYRQEKYAGEDLFSMFKKGDPKQAADYFVNTVIENSPYTIASIAGTMVGIPAPQLLTFLGAQQGAQTYAEARSKQLDEYDAMSAALANGALEAFWEQAGSLKIFDWAKKIFKDLGKEAGETVVKNTFKVALGAGFGEAGEEFFTQLTQDFSNKYYGVEDIPWSEFFPRAIEAGVTAFASGSAMTTTGSLISANQKQADSARAGNIKTKLDDYVQRKRQEQVSKNFANNFEKGEALSTDEKFTEQEAYDYVRDNVSDIMERYKSKFGNYVSTDDFRIFIPQYDGANANAIHEVASALKKSYQQQVLSDAKRQGNLDVLITSGGSGAGKTSLVQRSGFINPEQFGAILDSTLTNVNQSEKLIKRILDQGFRPKLAYVFRDVNEAWEGTLRRAASNPDGRVVPLDLHIKQHVGSLATIPKLVEKYGDQVNFNLYENISGSGFSEISLEGLAAKDYTDMSHRKELMKNAAIKAFQKGDITEEQLKGISPELHSLAVGSTTREEREDVPSTPEQKKSERPDIAEQRRKTKAKLSFDQFNRRFGDSRPESVVKREYEDLVKLGQKGIQPKFSKDAVNKEIDSLRRRAIKKNPSNLPTQKSLREEALKRLQDKFDQASADFSVVQRDIKADVRKVTGQYRQEEPTIKESAALKRVLESAEKASKQSARETKSRVNEAHKLVRKIQKADIQDITAQARVRINALQKTLKEAKTLEDLRRLNGRIQIIKDEGKAEFIANSDYRNSIHEFEKQTLLKTLLTGRKKAPKKAVTETKKPAFGKVLRYSSLRPSRLFDILDQKQDFKGPFNKIFYDQINNAYSNEVNMSKEATLRGLEIMSDNGITNKDLGRKMVVDGVEVTMDQAMHIYQGLSNLETRAAIAFGNNIGIQTQQKIASQLPDNFKKAAEQFVNEFDANYDRLRIALLEFTDGKEDLGRVEGAYIPMKRVERNYESSDRELMDELANRKGLRKAYAERGFTRGRIEISPEFQNPIELGLSNIYFNHIAKREHFINMGNVIKTLQRLANDKEISREIEDAYGPEMRKEIHLYVNRVGNPSIYKSFTNLEKIIRVLREKAAVVNLGFNMVTMAKQTPSLALMLGEVGPLELMAGVGEVLGDFKKVNEFVEQNDPQMAQRNIERELEEIKTVRPAGPDSVIHQLEAASFKGITLFDQLTTRAGWIAKYNQSRKNGASHEEAVLEAQKAILRTQPASAPKDIASIYATNEFLNLFTQFSNQLNQIWNMVTYDIPARATSGRGEAAILGGAGVVLNALSIWIMSNGRLPEEGEDYGDAFAEVMLAIIPVIGPMLNSWRKGFDGLPASFEVAKRAARGTKNLYKSIADKDQEQFLKFMDNSAYMLAFSLGVPYNQIRRSLEGIVALGTGEIDDYRKLIYSSSVIDKGKKGTKFK